MRVGFLMRQSEKAQHTQGIVSIKSQHLGGSQVPSKNVFHNAFFFLFSLSDPWDYKVAQSLS